MKSVTSRSTRPREMKPQRLTRGSAINTMLSRTDIVGTMPSALRSSGSSAVPAANDDRGEPVAHPSAADPHAAVVEALRPEDRLHRLRASRAEQARQAEHLAGPHRERHIEQLVPSGEPVGVEQHLVEHLLIASEARAPFGANLGDVPTEHRGDHLELGRAR